MFISYVSRLTNWVMFFFIFFCISGCTSLGIFALKETPLLKKPEFKNLPANLQASEFKDLEKTLPEMGKDDFERAGDINLQKQNFSKAYYYYGKALELQPDDLDLVYKKGLTLVSAKKSHEAIRVFQAVLKKDPNHSAAIAGIGQGLFQIKKYSEAEIYLKKAFEIDSTSWRAYNFLGMIYDKKKKYGRAIEEYEKAVVLKPDYGFLYNNLGVSHLLNGNYHKAAVAFYEAINLGYTESRTYNNLGVALARSGKYQEALETFKYGASHPSHAYNNLGCIYLEENKINEAIQCFRKAIEISPKFYIKASRNLDRAQKRLARDSNPF